MISVSVSGLEGLRTLIFYLDKSVFTNFCIEAIQDELTELMYEVDRDPEIPREYKDSLILFSNVQEGQVYLIAYSPGRTKWRRFGRHMVYEKYRCPIHKYFGGELTPEYTGLDYLSLKFKERKNDIITNIKNKILEYVRSAV